MKKFYYFITLVGLAVSSSCQTDFPKEFFPRSISLADTLCEAGLPAGWSDDFAPFTGLGGKAEPIHVVYYCASSSYALAPFVAQIRIIPEERLQPSDKGSKELGRAGRCLVAFVYMGQNGPPGEIGEKLMLKGTEWLTDLASEVHLCME